MQSNILFFIVILMSSICHGTQCVDWFIENKVFPSDKNCINKCVILPADMATFMCNLQCEKYCDQKCEIAPYWKKKIKDGRPVNWDIKSEKSKAWSDEEKEKIAQILNFLPERFKSLPLNGIYRMEKSAQIVNPGTASDSSIVLYDLAFSNPPFVLENVIVHELAHLLSTNIGRKSFEDYRRVLGWNDKIDFKRTGPFINSKAKDSPEEDFANNIENFLLNKEVLKDKVPIAYGWIIKNFSKDFTMKDKCKNEK